MLVDMLPVKLVTDYLVTAKDHRDALKSLPLSTNQRLHIEMRLASAVQSPPAIHKVANQSTDFRSFQLFPPSRLKC